jgi:hypothetical protein
MDRIFRWTIGDCGEVGTSILNTAVQNAKSIFRDYNFKFYVCLNSENKNVEKICVKNKIELYRSDWNSFPLPKSIIPESYDINSFSGVPRGRQGSFWKLCPPRLDLNSYEIVCDNDLIFQRSPGEIKEFLDSDKNLVTEEHIFSLGKYSKYINKPYNSGLYGLRPNYDFGLELFDKWKETQSMSPLLSRDEQGLIILTLTSDKFIEISREKTCFVFDQGEPKEANYKIIRENGFECQIVSNIEYMKSKLEKDMIHFLGANRIGSHFYWNKYKSKLL